MSTPSRQPAEPHDPHFEDPVLLEEDETVPPRPEEEAADLLRAEPDPQGHGAPDVTELPEVVEPPD
ncbi:hypothetical protein [Georgenia daeguensis]|uniref:Chromosome partitioning protein n=1 Tax=Georgenia daeguensis TaxID=908355 RepID=A0ABP8EP26_9MICO